MVTFSVLICSTRSFKDVFPSSELKKKKDQKFFPFLSFFLIFVSFFFFFPSKNSDMYSRVRVLYGFFFFFFRSIYTCAISPSIDISYIFLFFFFLFHTIFETYFRFDSTSTKQIYIYIRERDDESRPRHAEKLHF